RYSSSWCHWLPVATDIQLLPFQSRSSANRSAFSSSNQPTSSLVSGSMTLTLAIGLTPPIYDVSPLEAAALHRGLGGQTGEYPIRHDIAVGSRGVEEPPLVESDVTGRLVIAEVGDLPNDDVSRLLIEAELDESSALRHPAATRRRRVVRDVTARIRRAPDVFCDVHEVPG